MSAALTVVDLFAGAGGMSLGFKRAGFQTLWAADNSAAAVETFRSNLKMRINCMDITVDTRVPKPTVIVGGPPCQGFSSAGMRRSGDSRNTMVSTFSEIIVRTMPQMFVFENVEGFLTSERGIRVNELLDPLISCGYRIHFRKINAAHFGIPQHRKRVIAIGALGFDPTFPEPTHTATGAPGAALAPMFLPPTETVEDAIRHLPKPAAQAPGKPSDHYTGHISPTRKRAVSALEQGQTMRDLPQSYWHSSYRRRAFRRVKDGTPTDRRGGAPAGLRRLRADQPSKAITGGACSEFIHPWEDRFLTLRECACLQTFPEEYEFHGTKAERCALIGNAVPPRLAQMIAQGIVTDLHEKPREARPGALLSFFPGSKNGHSPAMQNVVSRIQARFQMHPG